MTHTVADAMTAPVLTLEAETTLDDAAGAMVEAGIKSLVVIDDDCRPVGILTSTDLLRLVAEDATASEATVADYMTTEIVTAAPDDSLRAVATQLLEEEINHLPVTDDGEAVGMLSKTDLTEQLAAGETGTDAGTVEGVEGDD
jgi:CBS domain-containing protein